jgi:hypothetical protein
MKRSIFMLSTVALMEVLLVLATVMAVTVVTTTVSVDTAFAQGRPILGGPPPGYSSRNPQAGDNPGAEFAKEPTTGRR